MTSSSAGRGIPPFPPWGDDTAWYEINETLAAVIKRLDSSEDLRKKACQLRACLATLGDLMAQAALHCCPDCEAVCCLHAKPFYNFQDLVYLHLGELPIPDAGQPVPSGAGTCIYLTDRGCGLARELRPWICTWYLCPAMRDAFSEKLVVVQTLIAAIKQQRLALEESLLTLLTGG